MMCTGQFIAQKAPASAAQVVDLPTPPLGDAKATMTACDRLILGNAVMARECGRGTFGSMQMPKSFACNVCI
jgi:hypothetical protein